MPIVTCPECQERFETADAGVDASCPRCRHVFAPKRREGYTESIQTDPAPNPTAPHSPNPELGDAPDITGRRPRGPRSPFPVAPLLVLLSGVLFFALIFSIGFNVWFLARTDHPHFQAEQMRMREQQAIQAQIAAQQAADLARQQEIAAREQVERQGKRVQDLQDELQRTHQRVKQAEADLRQERARVAELQKELNARMK